MNPHAHVRHHAHKAPPYVDAFIQMALPGAIQVKKTWGIPVAVMIAQAVQETGWGRHVVNNAYFGIKGKAPDGNSVDFATTEIIDGKVVHETDTFRAYKDFAESADDYGRFLNQNGRYKLALQHKNDPEGFIHAMAKAGYATDSAYAHKLISIIHSHGLAAYDK